MGSDNDELRKFSERSVDKDGASHETDSDGNLKLFNLEHNDDGLWLNANNGNPDNQWNASNRWVFVRNSVQVSPPMGGEFCLI